MPLPIGTLINVVTVLAGTVLGTVVGARLPDRVRETVLHSLGLVTLLVGADAGLQAFRPPLTEAAPRASVLLVMGSILIGGVVGELVGIDGGLTRVGEALRTRFGRGQSRFTEGFVVASLVFCVGPLTILGSLQDGLRGDYRLLAIKALLDGFAALAFASALGWGVGFSALTIVVYQGGLTLAAASVAGVFSGPDGDVLVAAITAVGGVMILGIGLRLLEVREVRVANLLPALVLGPVAFALVRAWG
ncbi:MAG TPA: DUF554 domain-containing protein [Actinomycetota bacterium]|nr:DUF554 domain-containing protein [Actinomycetota bacterium]